MSRTGLMFPALCGIGLLVVGVVQLLHHLDPLLAVLGR
jgi:hypothetical protein